MYAAKMFGMTKTPYKLTPPPTDLWFQKQRAYFNCLDSDNNGYLTIRDKEILIRDFESHPHGKKFIGRFHHNLDSIWCFLEVTSKLTYEKFLQQRLITLKKHRDVIGKFPDPEHMSTIKTEKYGYYKLIFDLTDINSDKFWDEAECKLHFEVFCRELVDDEEAIRIWKDLDKGERGKVSLGEFMIASYHYEMEEKPCTYDQLYGPLPDVKSARPKGY